MQKKNLPTQHTEGSQNDKLLSVGIALTAAIPIVGGSINSLISDYHSGRKHDRLVQLYHQLQEDLDALGEKINSEYTNTDDFLDVFEETARKVVNERDENKRSLYKNILVNSMLDDTVNYDRTEKYLRLLASLRPEHILYLSILKDPEKYDKGKGSPVGLGGTTSTSFAQIFSKLFPDHIPDDIMEVLYDLEYSRLIKDVYSGYHSNITDQGILLLRNRLTRTGQKFVTYLSL